MVVLVSCLDNQALSNSSTPASGEHKLSILQQRLIKESIDSSGFSGAVAIVEDGNILFSYVRDYENRDQQRLNTVRTRFALASVGKLFTAIGIHQLVEKGDLKLSDSVGDFLPNYQNLIVREKVTIQHLLKMKSGLGDIFDKTCDESTKRFLNHEDYFCLFENEPLTFEPGSDTAYSNAGYIILGRVIELVSGEDFYSYMDNNLFSPLGMKSTAYDEANNLRLGTATGYVYKRGDDVSERTNEVSAQIFESNGATGRGSAAGGGYSTVGDFSSLDKALRSGDLISHQSLAKIFSDDFINGKRGAGIAGGAPGVTTRYRLRTDGLSIIAFGNNDLASAPAVVRTIEEYLDER